jgi:hypothetical protein
MNDDDELMNHADIDADNDTIRYCNNVKDGRTGRSHQKRTLDRQRQRLSTQPPPPPPPPEHSLARRAAAAGGGWRCGLGSRAPRRAAPPAGGATLALVARPRVGRGGGGDGAADTRGRRVPAAAAARKIIYQSPYDQDGQQTTDGININL